MHTPILLMKDMVEVHGFVKEAEAEALKREMNKKG